MESRTTLSAPAKARKAGLRQSWALTLSLLAGSVLLLSLMCLFIGTQDFSARRFFSYFAHPAELFYNTLPVLLLVALFFLLTNRAWVGVLVPGLLLFAISFGNYFKVELRGEPFIASELALLGEAAGSLTSYKLVFPPWFFVLLGLLLLWTLGLFFLARARFPKKRILPRLAGALLSLGLLFGSFFLFYGKNSSYDRNRFRESQVFNMWKEADNHAAHGIVYSFLHSVSDAIPHTPRDYTPETAEAILSRYESRDIPADRKVNVVATMLESFTDLSEFDSVRFTADPYGPLHALQAEAYHGTLITDTVGGGTVNAERAFLTGYTYPQPSYGEPTASYVRYFASQGYSVQGAHCGNDWFYHRKSIMANLGFTDYYFNENYFGSQVPHLGDEAFFPAMRSLYEEAGEGPHFFYNLTYQGHGPYSQTELMGREYVSPEGISPEAYYEVNHYLNGAADTCVQVSKFVDSFRADPEPVVLVFWGDHKPAFGTGNVYYEELGISADAMSPRGARELYATPYLIWANDAARAILGDSFRGEGPTVSPAFLMSLVFDRCGWEGNAWMQYSRSLREQIPVMHRDLLFLEGQELSHELSPQGQALYDEFTIVQEYMRRLNPEKPEKTN